MKRLFMYFIIIVLICFLIPILLTNKFKSIDTISENILNVIENSENSTKNNEVQNYKYSEYGIIKLLHHNTGKIEELNIDDYLLGVVSAEMPATFELEALKAQAVVARTYTIYSIKNNSSKHPDANICDNSACCQAWISKDDRLSKWDEDKKEENWKKIEDAVFSTQGEVIIYNGEVIDAFFHSNSGGKTEEVSNVWGGADLPYLQSVETSGEDAYSQYLSEVTFLKDELITKVREKYSNFEINFDDSECIKINEYTDGNRVKTIKFGNLNLSGVEVRTMLGLKSANFSVDINDNQVKFTVKGYGHGVRNEPNRSRYYGEKWQ